MPYEDPIEAALRALTSVEWTKRQTTFETRVNNTHMQGIVDSLSDHQIPVHAEVSPARSGRYIVTVRHEDAPRVLRAVGVEKVEVKPARRKPRS